MVLCVHKVVLEKGIAVYAVERVMMPLVMQFMTPSLSKSDWCPTTYQKSPFTMSTTSLIRNMW